ncbi:MAG: metalloregulator ArsR/SmtB family transcription factor [Propionibacteriaceae bacterium]|nr:metalloregulator ArsR/SmtB family transcription factor [Propionibacteriaceae bacterium]
MRESETLDLAAEWSKLFKVLSDQTRLKLLLAMHYRGPGVATVSELALAAGVTLPTASAALVLMAEAGVIEPRRSGRTVNYALRDARIHDLLHHVGGGHEHD